MVTAADCADLTSYSSGARTGTLRAGDAFQSHFKMRSGNPVRTDGRDTYCSGLQVPARPKQIRCQRRGTGARAQENEGEPLPAAESPRGVSAADASNPFAPKKGFESAVQTATEIGVPVRRRDAQRGRRGQRDQRRHGRVGVQVWGPEPVLDRSAKAKVNELTGESNTNLGTCRGGSTRARDKVAELSSKDQYEFGDLTKLIVSRASQLTMKDATMLLKALLSNVGLSSVGECADQVFGGGAELSLLVDVGTPAGMVAVEIDKGRRR